MYLRNVYILTSALIVCCRADNYDFGVDLVRQHSSEVRQRLKDVTRFLLPLPEDELTDTLLKTARRYIPLHAASEECRNHSNYLLDSLLRGDIWALEMVDAASKLGAGVLDGHLQDLGNYRQCVRVEEPGQQFRVLDAASKLGAGVLDGHLQDLGNYRQCVRVEEPGQQFRGQHCLVDTNGILPKEIADRIHAHDVLPVLLDVVFSVCVPSSCSVDDVAANVNYNLAELNASVAGLVTCSTGEPLPFRTKDYIATAVFLGILFVVVLGSIYESHPVLEAFSLRSNFKNLMDTSKSDAEISCLNGLRVILILAVVMTHTFRCLIVMPNYSIKHLYEVLGSYAVGVSQACTLSVDGFFMIGGTVLTYNFFRKYLQNSKFNLMRFYIARYFRLTPLLMVVILYYSTLMAHQIKGPYFSRASPFIFEPCCQYWWAGFLQIMNFLGNPTCVFQSWYVSCDFQLYLISPLFILALLRRPKMGFLLLATFGFLSAGAAAVVAYVNRLGLPIAVDIFTGDRNCVLRENFFFQGFHFRLPTFLCGVALGYAMFNIKYGKIAFKPAKWFWLLGWCYCVATLIAVVTATFILSDTDHSFSPWADPFYLGFAGVLFCSSMAWIVFACFFGHGGLLNDFLSWSGFRPLGKLTFGVFLVHMIVIYGHIMSAQELIVLNHTIFWYRAAAYVVFSFALSFLTYLTVEVPFSRLVAHLLSGDKKKGSIMDGTTLSNQPVGIISKQ